jgi:hypothetical protein
VQETNRLIDRFIRPGRAGVDVRKIRADDLDRMYAHLCQHDPRRVAD